MTEPIRGQRIHPVYADSCYTHKNGCLLVSVNTPSRKLGVMFTSKPCKMIGFGNPERVHEEVQQFERELIAGLAIPPELMKGPGSYSTTKVGMDILEERFRRKRGC